MEWLEGGRERGARCLEIKAAISNHHIYHSTTRQDKGLKKPVKTSKYLCRVLK